MFFVGSLKGYTYKEGPVLEEAKDAVRCIIEGSSRARKTCLIILEWDRIEANRIISGYA